MSNTAKILIAAGFVGLLGLIIFSTTGLARVSAEVCMEFRGMTACAEAFGTSQEEALRTAKDVACSEIAFGRDDSILCTLRTEPKSVIFR
jgi:hypothetical protein